MFTQIKSRLTFANTVSVVALMVALGGGAYAVELAPNNSVVSSSVGDQTLKNKEIEKDSIKSGRLQDNGIRTDDIRQGHVRGPDIREGEVRNSDIRDGHVRAAELGTIVERSETVGLKTAKPVGRTFNATPVNRSPAAVPSGTRPSATPT